MSNQHPLIRLVVENAVVTIVTVVISIGFMAAAGYIFFEAQNELNQFAQVNAEFERQANEFKQAIKMARFNSASWLTSTSPEEMLGSIIVELGKHLSDGQLDPSFSEKALAWSAEALKQLEDERSATRGYVFERPILQKYQELVIQLYDAYSQFIWSISEALRYWRSETTKQRQARFENIRSSKRSIDDVVNALGSLYLQTSAEIQFLQKENEQKFKATKDRHSSFNKRLWFSAFGMVASVGLLAFVAWTIATQRSLNATGRSKKAKRKEN